MRLSSSLLTLTALAPLLAAATPAPADPSLASGGNQAPQCKFVFNDAMCKDHDKSSQFEFKVQVSDGLQYKPHPEIPQNVGSVSHCYDLVDTHAPSYSATKDFVPQYGPHGRTLLDADKRPLFAFGPGMGHMWMTEDKCKQNFKAVAVFEKSGCRGSYFWYNLPVMPDTAEESSVTHDGADWCVAPFKPFLKTVGGFQMWAVAPSGEFAKFGAVAS